MSLSFKYNDSGLRTHKTVTQNGVTTTYTYAWSQDGRLISQSDGTTTLYFIYDENSEIIGFSKLTATANEMYYYVKNLQGDVCAIVDSTGATVVSYVYDAWGYLINITGSQATTLGVLNPIRYRGYYYDTETGYYYLQSRYYDPLWGRFINADTSETVLSIEKSILLRLNLFVCCLNNPCKYIDKTGYEAEELNNSLIIAVYLGLGLGCFADCLDAFSVELVKSTKYTKGKISIDLSKTEFQERIKLVIEYYGKKYAYSMITAIALDLFNSNYSKLYAKATDKECQSREFLFSNSCVYKEIKLHIEAFFWSIGESGFSCNAMFLAWAIKSSRSILSSKTKPKVKQATISTDISEADVIEYSYSNLSKTGQAVVFGYFDGIREKYKSTDSDPYFIDGKRRYGKVREGWLTELI